MSDENQMATAVAHYLENSKMKSNGVREVPKAAFVERMKAHGVTEDDYNKVQDAVNFETTAAARVALADVKTKISEASKSDLKSDEFRRGLSSTVRLPTFGGATEVEITAETSNRIPQFGDNDGNSEPQFKVNWGRLRTQVHAKGRVDKGFHDEAREEIRAALGIKD